MALALYRPVFWVVVLLAVLALLWLARRLHLRWWPAWPLRSVLVVLALVGIFSPRGEFILRPLSRPQVMLVDQSDSLAAAEREQLLQKAGQWQQAAPGRMLVAFADRPQVLLSGVQPSSVPDGRASDLAAALEKADELLPPAPADVILATDGIVRSSAQIQASLERLKQKGRALIFLQQPARSQQGDGSVLTLNAPSVIWEGSPFDVLVQIAPPGPDVPASLELRVNGELSPAQARQGGEDLYSFRLSPQPQGILTLQASAGFGEAQTAVDPLPANNSAYAAVQVLASPRVLLVSRQELDATARAFQDNLEAAGLVVDLIAVENLPSNLEALRDYQVVFLHNLLASSISPEQMLALRVFVSRQGGGLVFLGGRNSYTLGGYQDTILESMLPVKLEPPPRSQKPPVVFLLVLDRSGSMTGVMDLLREAAMRAIEILQPTDYLGVLIFSDDSTWQQPLGLVGDGLVLRETLDKVSRLTPSGGTKMFAALQEAQRGLAELPISAPEQRHLLLLSDGQSDDGKPGLFTALAAELARQETTISTIALGYGADRELMPAIALEGKGRYHEVFFAKDLPGTMILESQAAHSENIQQGQTSLKAGETAHPVLFGLAEAQLPVLNGYNALTSKADQGAEDVLLSASFDDPLLSVWHYGLGRVTAWMGDAGEEWTQDWPSPEAAGLFWSQVVRYTLPGPPPQPLQASLKVEDTRLVVEAFLQDDSGKPVNRAELIFSYADADGQIQNYRLPEQGAGLYRLEISRPVEGAYRALVAYQPAEGEKVEAPLPFAVNTPAEWMALDVSAGQANLQAWADQTGGSLTQFEALADSEPQPPDSSPAVESDWWWWLLLLLIVLWPLEIALRRRWLPWM